MDNGAITVSQKDLQRYILRLDWRGKDGLTGEDAYKLEQIGRFFTVNLHLVSYAQDIQELALTPRGDGLPPLAKVTITREFHVYRLASDENGYIPHFRR